jgi:hypothetical protein
MKRLWFPGAALTPAAAGPTSTASQALGALGQLICATGATGLGSCPSGSHYPKQTRIVMAPIPRLPSMPNPCPGAPRNGFCAHH